MSLRENQTIAQRGVDSIRRPGRDIAAWPMLKQVWRSGLPAGACRSAANS